MVRELSKLKQEFESFIDGVAVSRKMDQKNESNQFQYQYNVEHLKFLCQVLDRLEEERGRITN